MLSGSWSDFPRIAEASGELNPEEFEAFLAEALGLAASHSRSEAVWFAFMDWRHASEMIRAANRVFDAWRKETGDEPVRDGDGRNLASLEAERIEQVV